MQIFYLHRILKISIIIPTYNRAALLRDALKSIADFVSCECEVLVCDDGSTDSTRELCMEVAATGVDIVHSRSDARCGAQEARNRGLRQATGDAVMFMDSDDAFAGPGIMALASALEEDPELGYAYGRVAKTDEMLRPLDSIHADGFMFENVPREVAGYHWHTMGALYRRRRLEDVGPWNPDLTGSQDWEYQARVKLFGGRGLFVDVLVGCWRQHDGDRVGTTAFRPDYVESVMLACDSILRHARAAKRCDAALEQRIAKKLIVHALEWGKYGYPEMRKECLRLALGHLTHGQPLKSLIRVAIHSPTVLDGHAWNLLARRNR